MSRTAAAAPGREQRLGRRMAAHSPAFLLILLLLVASLALLAGCAGNLSAEPEASAPGATTVGGPDSADSSGNAGGGRLLVSAAADLAPVLQELVPRFEEATGAKVEVNLGSTGQLAQQIEAGAPVDLFLAASAQAIDELEGAGRLVPGTRREYARGRLVLWSGQGHTLGAVEELAGDKVARISIANPDHAPYGRAAREALQSSGLWESLQPRLVYAENVRQAFQFAQAGEVDAALVALSLAKSGGEGSFVLVPESLHEPLRQTLAVVEGSQAVELAQAFAEFMAGAEGRRVLTAYGFQVP